MKVLILLIILCIFALILRRFADDGCKSHQSSTRRKEVYSQVACVGALQESGYSQLVV